MSKNKIKKVFKIVWKIFYRTFLILFICSVISVLMLKWINPVTSSIMVQRQFSSLINLDFEFVQYQWINLDEVSDFIPIAFVAAEDQNFPAHFGFDFDQIEKAIKDSNRGKRLRGASTITQQVAKNLFLWEGKSFVRKGVEAYFTLLIELLWSKKRILEVYINIVEMGDMIFGVGMASLIYFKRVPEKLSISQAALLASVLPNPKSYSVKNPSAYVRGRQAWIIKQIYSLGGSSYLKDI